MGYVIICKLCPCLRPAVRLRQPSPCHAACLPRLGSLTLLPYVLAERACQRVSARARRERTAGVRPASSQRQPRQGTQREYRSVRRLYRHRACIIDSKSYIYPNLLSTVLTNGLSSPARTVCPSYNCDGCGLGLRTHLVRTILCNLTTHLQRPWYCLSKRFVSRIRRCRSFRRGFPINLRLPAQLNEG